MVSHLTGARTVRSALGSGQLSGRDPRHKEYKYSIPANYDQLSWSCLGLNPLHCLEKLLLLTRTLIEILILASNFLKDDLSLQGPL